MSTRITITNTYPNRTNQVVETVPTPIPRPAELADWWEDIVWPLTGDGSGSREYAIYNAVVIESDIPALVGLSYEWDG